MTKLAGLLLWVGLAVTCAGGFIGADSKSPTTMFVGNMMAIVGLIGALAGIRLSNRLKHEEQKSPG